RDFHVTGVQTCALPIYNCFNARAMHAVISSETGKTWVPTLSHQEPASFGSLEITQRSATEQIGQKIDYSAASGTETAMVTLDSRSEERRVGKEYESQW